MRFDITLSKGTEVLYTPSNEIQLFTPFHTHDNHATIILEPGRLSVTEVITTRRPNDYMTEQNEVAFSNDWCVVVRCKYERVR